MWKCKRCLNGGIMFVPECPECGWSEEKEAEHFKQLHDMETEGAHSVIWPADAVTGVVRDLVARREVGLRRYGKAVHAGDVSENWLRHAYEEALDGAVYLRAAMEREEAMQAELALLRLENARLTTLLATRRVGASTDGHELGGEG